MIKKVLQKFGGAIFFYLVIVAMVFLVNNRFKNLNDMNEESEYTAFVYQK